MSELDSIDKEIQNLNQNLQDVLAEISELKKRQQKYSKSKQDALVFIEKAEKVISLAEQGKVQLTKEQKLTIQSALLKIQKLFSS